MISPDEQKVLSSFAERIPANDPGAHNNLAIIYYNKGLYREAIKELEIALGLNPRFILARSNLEIILRKTGMLDERIEQLSKEIEQDPEDEDKILELADTYVKLKKYSHGIIYYKKVLERNPNSYRAHFGFSDTLKYLGKYADAIEEMNLALDVRQSHEGYRALGEIYLRKGVIDAAIKNFEEALKFDDTSSETHFLLGFALGEKGRVMESIEAMKTAIALNPSLAQTDSDALIDIVPQPGQWETIKKQIGVPEVAGDSYKVHYNMGMSYRNKGLFDEAEKEFRECLRLNEDAAEARYAVVESALYSGKYEEAIHGLQDALGRDCDPLKCYNALGIAYLMQGQTGTALECLERVLVQSSSEPLALNNIAVAQYTLGDVDKALEHFTKAVQAGNNDARYNLALHHLKKSEYEKALALLDYEGVDAYFGRGLVYMEQGDDQKALDALKRVLQDAPHHAGAYYNLGFVATRLGRYEDSLAYIRKGMEIEPNYENVKYHLSLDPVISEFGPYLVPRAQSLAAEALDKVFTPHALDPGEFVAKAEELLGQNQPAEAIQQLDEALKIEPRLSRAVILKADIQFHQGAAAQAIALLEEHLNEQPDDIEVSAVLARMLKESGRIEEAEAKYRHLADLQPANPAWLNELADLAYAGAREEEALDLYLKVYEQDPENSAANLRLFGLYVKRNALAEAARFMQFMAERHPDDYEYNVLSGIYWSDKQQYENAERHFDKAIQIDPSKPLPYHHRGLLSVQRGAFESACESWKRALLLSPPEDLAERIKHCLKLTIELSEILQREI
ncbi:tetratricopeptide repeat protein [candidate division WOR-3 bacterium]|nr:tetratricopeptide repeat protein [candidate division WOR-3 bacterium]